MSENIKNVRMEEDFLPNQEKFQKNTMRVPSHRIKHEININAKFLREFQKKRELSRRLVFADLINGTLLSDSGLKKICQILKRQKFLKDMNLDFVA